jgi:acyl-CoA synthetase (AMP-forming)/AMP-acid ligase II
VPTGEHGEIWLRTPQLMKGFLNKPDETAEVITEDGWFRTGDMGRVDDDGFVFVEDRLKDMIISGGENIYSPEVERVLAEHPAVMEVAIIGVPDDRGARPSRPSSRSSRRRGDRGGARRVPASTSRTTSAPSVDILDALPRNPTGKILKREPGGRPRRGGSSA